MTALLLSPRAARFAAEGFSRPDASLRLFRFASQAGLAEHVSSGMGAFDYATYLDQLRSYADDGNVAQAQALWDRLLQMYRNDAANGLASGDPGFQSALDYIASRVPGAAARQAQWNASVNATQARNRDYDQWQGQKDDAYEACMVNLRREAQAMDQGTMRANLVKFAVNPVLYANRVLDASTYAELVGPQYCAAQTGGGDYEAGGLVPGLKRTYDKVKDALTDWRTWAVIAGLAAAGIGAAAYLHGRGMGRQMRRQNTGARSAGRPRRVPLRSRRPHRLLPKGER